MFSIERFGLNGTDAAQHDNTYFEYYRANVAPSIRQTSIFCHSKWKSSTGFAMVPYESMIAFFTRKGVSLESDIAFELALKENIEPRMAKGVAATKLSQMDTIEFIQQGSNVPNYCLGEHEENDHITELWQILLQSGLNPPDLIIVRGNYGGHSDVRPPEDFMKISDIFLRIRKFQVGARSPNGFVFRFYGCRDADPISAAPYAHHQYGATTGYMPRFRDHETKNNA